MIGSGQVRGTNIRGCDFPVVGVRSGGGGKCPTFGHASCCVRYKQRHRDRTKINRQHIYVRMHACRQTDNRSAQGDTANASERANERN